MESPGRKTGTSATRVTVVPSINATEPASGEGNQAEPVDSDTFDEGRPW